MKTILVPALLMTSTFAIGYATENQKPTTTTHHYSLDGLPVYSMNDGKARFDASAVIAAVLNKLEADGKNAEKPLVEIKATEHGKVLAITHFPESRTKINSVLDQIRSLSPHHKPEELLFHKNASH